MKMLSENDRRGGAMFGIVTSMATLFIVCITSSDTSAMICFCVACTAMLSMMQLASVFSPDFSNRYKWLMYFFAIAPVVYSVIHLFRERSRILESYGHVLYGVIPVGIFIIAYSWYLKTHGVEVSETSSDVNETAITKQ